MRTRTLRKALILLAPGCLLWASCPSGSARFLAPSVQPALARLFTDFAVSISEALFP